MDSLQCYDVVGGGHSVAQSAYIKFVQGSSSRSLSLNEVKEHLQRYCEQTGRTGEQLDWNYTEAAFPYTVETKPGEEERWFYLKGTTPQYKFILFGVGELRITNAPFLMYKSFFLMNPHMAIKRKRTSFANILPSICLLN